MSAPTVAAWIAAADISPAKDIKARNLLDACRVLNVRPEWVVYNQLPKRPSARHVDQEVIDMLAALPDEPRQLVIAQIKAFASLTKENVNSVSAEKSGTMKWAAPTQSPITTGASQSADRRRPRIASPEEAAQSGKKMGVERAERGETKKGGKS